MAEENTLVLEVLKRNKRPIFSTKDSLEEALHEANQILVDAPVNKVQAALSVYHNTLLSELEKQIKTLH
ncbi:hypothetical protein [Marinobacterium litorale]|uniref:hypothetical protein n=1 Tax=Marinobacterium litorale TaxID=404770 RepID=UPI000417A2E5|nr:hypothetical protein [Marinobacterium litorale]